MGFNTRETDFEAAYSALRRDVKAALGSMPEKCSDFELVQAVAAKGAEIRRLRDGVWEILAGLNALASARSSGSAENLTDVRSSSATGIGQQETPAHPHETVGDQSPST